MLFEIIKNYDMYSVDMIFYFSPFIHSRIKYKPHEINTQHVAMNTVLLYLRLFVMMVIGLLYDSFSGMPYLIGKAL